MVNVWWPSLGPVYIRHWQIKFVHYCDVIMGAVASQITSLMIVYSTVYSDADQRKHQSSASLAFVWGIHLGPVNSPHKWPVTRKMFPFDDVIMTHSATAYFGTMFCLMMSWFPASPGPCLNIKTVFPRYGDSHVKDETVVRPSYIKRGDPYTGKQGNFTANLATPWLPQRHLAKYREMDDM